MLDGQTSPVFCFHPYRSSHNHGNRKWPYCKGNRSWGNQDPLWEEEPCFQSNENPYGLGGSNFFCWILSQNLAATLPKWPNLNQRSHEPTPSAPGCKTSWRSGDVFCDQKPCDAQWFSKMIRTGSMWLVYLLTSLPNKHQAFMYIKNQYMNRRENEKMWFQCEFSGFFRRMSKYGLVWDYFWKGCFGFWGLFFLNIRTSPFWATQIRQIRLFLWTFDRSSRWKRN